MAYWFPFVQIATKTAHHTLVWFHLDRILFRFPPKPAAAREKAFPTTPLSECGVVVAKEDFLIECENFFVLTHTLTLPQTRATASSFPLSISICNLLCKFRRKFPFFIDCTLEQFQFFFGRSKGRGKLVLCGKFKLEEGVNDSAFLIRKINLPLDRAQSHGMMHVRAALGVPPGGPMEAGLLIPSFCHNSTIANLCLHFLVYRFA